eukprot:gnl/MRDRNA2_/MRDRNA2_55161_c0_seq1.p1 gnl/MRDRNA2_/MRDRNA2_55161_c0~~gnl/MRDRNA2_/MRDRNA2_55161_c0_seq1.p1  ORF type:complete len:147 (+),score=18.82 gnl/MRDRNA2_/MRDRNA2_55161_c0_seq1:162-602(+)
MEPWGITGLHPEEERQVKLSNILIHVVMEMMLLLATMGGFSLLEHPRDPGYAPYPSIWATTLLIETGRKLAAKYVELDQCRKGARSMKPTTLMTTVDDPSALDLQCNHLFHERVLKGATTDGSFMTSGAQRYPSEMCKEIARFCTR